MNHTTPSSLQLIPQGQDLSKAHFNTELIINTIVTAFLPLMPMLFSALTQTFSNIFFNNNALTPEKTPEKAMRQVPSSIQFAVDNVLPLLIASAMKASMRPGQQSLCSVAFLLTLPQRTVATKSVALTNNGHHQFNTSFKDGRKTSHTHTGEFDENRTLHGLGNDHERSIHERDNSTTHEEHSKIGNFHKGQLHGHGTREYNHEIKQKKSETTKIQKRKEDGLFKDGRLVRGTVTENVIRKTPDGKIYCKIVKTESGHFKGPNLHEGGIGSVRNEKVELYFGKTGNTVETTHSFESGKFQNGYLREGVAIINKELRTNGDLRRSKKQSTRIYPDQDHFMGPLNDTLANGLGYYTTLSEKSNLPVEFYGNFNERSNGTLNVSPRLRVFTVINDQIMSTTIKLSETFRSKVSSNHREKVIKELTSLTEELKKDINVWKIAKRSEETRGWRDRATVWHESVLFSNSTRKAK